MANRKNAIMEQSIYECNASEQIVVHLIYRVLWVSPIRYFCHHRAGLTPSSSPSFNALSLPSSAATSSSTFSSAASLGACKATSLTLQNWRYKVSVFVSHAFRTFKTYLPSALSLSFFLILHPPLHPTHPSSHGPLAPITQIAAITKPTLTLPLAIQPPAAYTWFPAAVPIN